MNVSVDKKTQVVHNKKTKHNIKKKKQRTTQIKPKHKKKKPSPSHPSPTTTSIVIATHQPTLLQDAPIVFLSTPIPTATPLTLLPTTDQEEALNDVTDQDTDQGFYQVEQEETDYTASAAAIHKMEDTDAFSTQQQPKTVSTATRVTQIAAPVIGVFGGIALIAAAMFYVVRKRKRNSMLVQDMSNHNKKLDFDYDNATKSNYYTEGDEMHDISLLDEQDEAIMVMGQPPKLTPANNDANNTMHRHYHSTIIHVPETHPVNNSSNMTDHTIHDATSRANSLHLPPLSYRNSSCRSSTTSTVYTDALMSPISSVFDHPNHTSSFLMIAERQQLHHQRPSILDHFSNNSSDIKPSRSSPIETYKAQLTELAVLDQEEEEEEERDQEPPHDATLPFSTVIDLTQVY